MRYAGRAGVTKLTYGATLAAALHALMVRQRDATGLIAFDRTVHTVMPAERDAGAPGHALRHARPDRGRARRPRRAPRPSRRRCTTSPSASRAAALVVVVSDLFDDADTGRDAARAPAPAPPRPRGRRVPRPRRRDRAPLRASRHAGPRPRPRDGRGADASCRARSAREVVEAAEGFVAEMQRRCREARVDYVPLDTAQPYAEALRAYLDKRRRLY